jgi:hypothetical protein
VSAALRFIVGVLKWTSIGDLRDAAGDAFNRGVSHGVKNVDLKRCITQLFNRSIPVYDAFAVVT